MDNKKITLNIDDHRDLFNRCYTIPEEYRPAVKKAIKKYANTRFLSDEKIDIMVTKTTSPRDTFKTVSNNVKDGDYTRWLGNITEWFAALEYNSRINNSNSNVVMTIVNPDPSSKADLLHIVTSKEGFHCVSGPDIKTGKATYLINQLKKTWDEREEIPFMDYYDILSNDKNYSPKQKKQLIELQTRHPKKKILKSELKAEDTKKFARDYLFKVARIEINSDTTNIEDIKNALSKAKATFAEDLQEESWASFNLNIFKKEKQDLREKRRREIQQFRARRERDKYAEDQRKKIEAEGKLKQEEETLKKMIKERSFSIKVKNTIKDFGKFALSRLKDPIFITNVIIQTHKNVKGHYKKDPITHKENHSPLNQKRNSPIFHEVKATNNIKNKFGTEYSRKGHQRGNKDKT